MHAIPPSSVGFPCLLFAPAITQLCQHVYIQININHSLVHIAITFVPIAKADTVLYIKNNKPNLSLVQLTLITDYGFFFAKRYNFLNQFESEPTFLCKACISCSFVSFKVSNSFLTFPTVSAGSTARGVETSKEPDDLKLLARVVPSWC